MQKQNLLKYWLTLLLFLLIIFVSQAQNGINQSPINKTSIIGMEILWQIEGENIKITIKAPTTGWVSIGFDPVFMMKDANIIIGYIKEGDLFIRDDFGNANTRHTPDTQLGGIDNVLNAEGVEENGTTTLIFSIPLDSGDKVDRALIKGEEYTIILAYGKDQSDSFTSYHKKRGKTTIKL